MAHPVDIVIPVYRGEAETRTCLESVLAARGEREAEIVVVDDAGPEPGLRAWLARLAAAGRVTLLAHESNRGFVASVNEAMALHPDRDVVLLNSDTEVAPGWLDRLTAHAARDPRIGTATPFSSNATICSYPRTLENNPLPQGESTASLDAAFAAANPGTAADIPTAVGFCMHVTRRCLDAVGAFDEARYGAGYGEEVDFCMRAARQGFRHVLAGDVFVRHLGEVSFGPAGGERRARAQALVDALYPEFQVRLREFLATDPARPLRRRADVQRMRRAVARRPLLLGRAGATQAASGDALRLRRLGGGAVRLTWERPGEEYAEDFAGVGGMLRLAALLARVHVGGVRRGSPRKPRV